LLGGGPVAIDNAHARDAPTPGNSQDWWPEPSPHHRPAGDTDAPTRSEARLGARPLPPICSHQGRTVQVAVAATHRWTSRPASALARASSPNRRPALRGKQACLSPSASSPAANDLVQAKDSAAAGWLLHRRRRTHGAAAATVRTCASVRLSSGSMISMPNSRSGPQPWTTCPARRPKPTGRSCAHRLARDRTSL